MTPPQDKILHMVPEELQGKCQPRTPITAERVMEGVPRVTAPAVEALPGKTNTRLAVYGLEDLLAEQVALDF